MQGNNEDFLLKRQVYYTKMLEDMPVRDRPSYEEENTKVMLRAKLNLIEELLEKDHPAGLAVLKTYRVELVDYIDAESEHQAIEIFEKVIFDIDPSDDMYDVYEVDPLTNKAVKKCG